ncbi:MAG: hypothetical protein HY796_00570 [Elusimicrobia bacterium]|nr:hypothetical protein [Elusimicrobiota bacterium]
MNISQGLPERARNAVGGLPREDRILALLLFAWFFITICSYAMLRPVRSALILFSYGPAALPWMYMATGFVTGVAVYVFSKFAGLPRRRLIGGTLIIFALNLFLWWWIAVRAGAARAAGAGGWGWTSPAFYVWTDVFSIMAVTVFWMYAADVFRTEDAKRVFPIIGAAGPAGGMAGSWLTEILVRGLGTVNILLAAAGVYMLVLFLFFALERRARGRCARAGAEGVSAGLRPPGLDTSRLAETIRWIASSRLLLFLTLLVALERMVPDFSDFIFQSAGRAAFNEPNAYTRFFAGFEKWCNFAALGISLFLAAPFLRLAGVRAALVSLPATLMVFGSAFIMAPGLGAAVLLKGAEASQRHSWFKAGKEVIYTTTDRDVIYRIKGYIEMFVYRFSRGLAGLAILCIIALGGGPAAVAAASLPLAGVWVWCAWGLGGEYRALERAAADKLTLSAGNGRAAPANPAGAYKIRRRAGGGNHA